MPDPKMSILPILESELSEFNTFCRKNERDVIEKESFGGGGGGGEGRRNITRSNVIYKLEVHANEFLIVGIDQSTNSNLKFPLFKIELVGWSPKNPNFHLQFKGRFSIYNTILSSSQGIEDGIQSYFLALNSLPKELFIHA